MCTCKQRIDELEESKENYQKTIDVLLAEIEDLKKKISFLENK